MCLLCILSTILTILKGLSGSDMVSCSHVVLLISGTLLTKKPFRGWGMGNCVPRSQSLPAIVHKAKPGDWEQNDNLCNCGRMSTANMAETTGHHRIPVQCHFQTLIQKAPQSSETQKCSLPWASPEHRDALAVSCRLFSHTSSSCLIQGRTLWAGSSCPVSAEKGGSSEGVRRHSLSCYISV